MQNLDVEKTLDAWAPLAGTIIVPHTVEEYNRIVALLDDLIDEVGENESHPLASLMEILGVLIEHYENLQVTELVSE
jgi:HTH-type transcriptional regulator/antitoxin HigA